MTSRRSIEVDGIAHGNNPIPMGARVGPLVCSSGIMGADPATGDLPTDGREQVRLVFANLRSFLAAAGAGPEHVVKVDVLLADPALRSALNEEWMAMFPDRDSRPARHTTIRDLANAMVIQLEIMAFGGSE